MFDGRDQRLTVYTIREGHFSLRKVMTMWKIRFRFIYFTSFDDESADFFKKRQTVWSETHILTPPNVIFGSSLTACDATAASWLYE